VTTPKKVRKTLWSIGRKGSLDWMRVIHDVTQDRAEVAYKDRNGKRRKKLFPGDKKGRDHAVEWAQGFHNERTRIGAARTETTHGQLWAAFIDSPAWGNLRETSHASYVDRWMKWENFRGASTKPADTTLHSIDQFITRARETMAINQVRNVLNVARLVYNWGYTRKLITENPFVGYRWKQPKDAKVEEPEEYSPAEYTKLLAELDPRDGRRWRAHVALMIAGHHGARANAILSLRWEYEGVPLIQGSEVVWPPAFQKNGKELRQPLTWDLVATLETARYWRRSLGYDGPWVLFAGGGNKKLGAAVTQRQNRRRRAEGKQVITVVRKERTPEQDTHYTYGGLWESVRAAEDRAGVPHKAYRLLHGARKMTAGNIADATGDMRLAMEFIGDDVRQAPAYLKRRENRLERAADAIQTKGGK
jgi:integrase